MTTSIVKLRQLVERWTNAEPSERANYQLYLLELAEALGVERPRPAGTGYSFEFAVKVVARDGSEATNFIDLYKERHFVLEAKNQARDESDSALLRRAFGQARAYAAAVSGSPPPFLLVLDVGKSLTVWDRWSGSYGGFNAGRRISLTSLSERPEDISLLSDIFETPAARDPRARAAAVTRDIAAKLAVLAASLEGRGHPPEEVAGFLIRCVFTMFAEDIGLLPDEPFQTAVSDIGLRDPSEFAIAATELWRAMDAGQRFGLRRLLRFNGHFFRDPTALPLTRQDLVVLHEASLSDWGTVEPSIFGTLLTRALDPAERHRLGAEFTPRPFVERVIRPTIEAPVRERWAIAQAEVLQLQQTGKRRDAQEALRRLRHFHEWLRSLRVLDPACGSGNFLYVALNTLKRIEFEVLRMIEEISGQPELAVEEVGPWQFHGIEVKPWAREVAELCLWVGHFQAWRELHGHTQPPEPVLRDTGTLACRDAVLAWDGKREDPGRSRLDPAPRIRHPVTGDLVPDPNARLPYFVYEGARPAPWPRADFIVGNPPYMGRGRQREAYGDGYIDALRAAYPEVPDNADYVMYWWYRAAEEVAAGRATRAGLITTNTITQRHNREVIELEEQRGAGILWAVADHPWVDETGSAAVRVAMTVTSRRAETASLVRVDIDGNMTGEIRAARLNADLTAHADVAGAASEPLLANRGLSSQGFTLVGEGFRIEPDVAKQLREADPRHAAIVRPIVNGRDLTARPRGIYTVDFALMNQQEAKAYPVLYDLLRDRVYPTRVANPRAAYARYWWRFGETRSGLRHALDGLFRYIATVETAKHRVFQFLPTEIAAEHSVVCIALEDAFSLGVLSSRAHVTWALAAGGRLGVGNDPRYQKALCFDPFPFPTCAGAHRDRVAELGERMDQHRKDAIARDRRVTITSMYNIVDKLNLGEALTAGEHEVHRLAACGVLRDLHEELDRAVAHAYAWKWPLEREEILARLVTLHDERLAEEGAGRVRWLRPNYQMQRFGGEPVDPDLPAGSDIPAGTPPASARLEWPNGAPDQIRALRDILATQPVTVETASARFRGARRDLVERHLETLVLIGEARRGDNGTYHAVADAA